MVNDYSDFQHNDFSLTAIFFIEFQVIKIIVTKDKVNIKYN